MSNARRTLRERARHEAVEVLSFHVDNGVVGKEVLRRQTSKITDIESVSIGWVRDIEPIA